MESQLPLLGAKAPSSLGKACVEGSIADGPETPMFFFSVLAGTPNIEESGNTFTMGLVLTSQEPVPHRAFYLPFPGMMSPGLRVGDAFYIGEHNLVRRLKFPFGEYGKQGTFLNPCVHMCVSACTHVCLRKFR